MSKRQNEGNINDNLSRAARRRTRQLASGTSDECDVNFNPMSSSVSSLACDLEVAVNCDNVFAGLLDNISGIDSGIILGDQASSSNTKNIFSHESAFVLTPEALQGTTPSVSHTDQSVAFESMMASCLSTSYTNLAEADSGSSGIEYSSVLHEASTPHYFPNENLHGVNIPHEEQLEVSLGVPYFREPSDMKQNPLTLHDLKFATPNSMDFTYNDAQDLSWVLDACYEPPTVDEVQSDHINISHDPYNESSMDEEYFDAQDTLDFSVPENEDNQPLYDGAPLTVRESLVSILTFAQTEKLSGISLSRLLQLISVHLPKPNLFSNTTHQFFKRLATDNIPVHIFYYCSACLRPIDSSRTPCDKCENPKKTVENYLYLPIAPQLNTILSRPGVLSAISDYRNKPETNHTNITDVKDGKLYQDAKIDSNCISLTWNTDGVPPYKSSSYSLYPIFLVINELPPSERFKRENVIIAGLWGSYVKPHPNIFLRPIYEEICMLKTSGVDVKPHDSDTVLNFKVIILCGTLDSPAKALFLNMKHHSGYNSCPKCYILGEKSARTGDVLVFPYQIDLQLRSHQFYWENVLEAIRTRGEVLGVKGPTILFHLVFDMIRSTTIDVMHCVYLGLVRQILNLLFNSTYSKEPFSLTKMIKEIDKWLLSVTLPHFVQREMVSVEKLAFWKASVFRNFFLYICLPLFSEIMPTDQFDNLKLVVCAVALLNSQNVSMLDIKVADFLLIKFSEEFQLIYGLRHMSFNVHLSRHLANTVEEVGPAWATSCFGFEDLNGQLTSLIHGSTHAGLQIAANLSLLTELPHIVDKLPPGSVKDYCEKLQHKFKRLNINEFIEKHLFSIGKYSLDIEITPELEHYQRVFSFCRLYKGHLYVAQNYQRGSRVSSFVKYKSNNNVYFGNILFFVKGTQCTCNDCYCMCPGDFLACIERCHTDYAFSISNVNIPNYFCGDFCVPHIRHVLPSDQKVVDTIPVNDLLTVCFKFIIREKVYICEPLNSMEMQ